MIRAFLQNLAEAYSTPRQSARRMLTADPSMPDCALMVVLSFLVQSVFGVAAGLIAGDAPGFAALGARLSELALQFVLFAALTAGAYAVGRRFGGRASPQQMAQVIGWHYLATAFLAPFNLIGASAMGDMTTGEGPGALFLLIPLSLGVSIWMFAAFVAEAHGFKRMGGVVAASVAGFLALGMLTMVLVSVFALGPAPA